MSINQFKQFGILGLCKIVRLLHIEKHVLREKLVIKFGFFAKHSQTTRDAIFNEICPKTFFAVLELILTDHSRPIFHKVPYLILLNPNDNRINHSYIESCLTKEKVKYQILPTSLEHFPKQLDSVTLGKSIDHNSITKALDFLFNQQRG